MMGWFGAKPNRSRALFYILGIGYLLMLFSFEKLVI